MKNDFGITCPIGFFSFKAPSLGSLISFTKLRGFNSYSILLSSKALKLQSDQLKDKSYQIKMMGRSGQVKTILSDQLLMRSNYSRNLPILTL